MEAIVTQVVDELARKIANDFGGLFSIDEQLIVASSRKQLEAGLPLGEESVELLKRIAARKSCAQTILQLLKLQSRAGQLDCELENEFLRGLLKRIRHRGDSAIFSQYERENVEYLFAKYIQRPNAKLQ